MPIMPPETNSFLTLEVFWGLVLLACCVIIHAAGLAFMLRQIRPTDDTHRIGAVRAAVLLVKIACTLVCLHLLEITLWAGFYRWRDCFTNMQTALYFSGTTYTTIGFGDIVLPPTWWLLAPIEGLTGILMCGLSTGTFFVVINGIFKRLQAPPPPTA